MSSNEKGFVIKFGNYNIRTLWATENDFIKEKFPYYLWKNRKIAFFDFFSKFDFDVVALQAAHHISLKNIIEEYGDKYRCVGYCSELDKQWNEIKEGDYYGSILAYLVKKDQTIKVVSHKKIKLPDGAKHKRIMVELVCFISKIIRIFMLMYIGKPILISAANYIFIFIFKQI